MAKAWADAQKLAPGDAAVQAFTDPNAIFLPLAYSVLNPAAWGAQLDTAAMYFALHLFTVGNETGGAGGPVNSEKVGDVQRARDILQENAWDSTPYGKMYRILLRTLPGRMGFVSGSSVLPPLYTPFFP